ncbi:heme-binding protein, partial [Lysobacter sp. 2RAB21]
FQRMDGTPNSSVEVAIGKAVHAVNYRRDTAFHQKLLSEGNNVVLGLPGITPIEGGVRLLHGDQVIGGIGVSGAQAAQDGEIAQAGADLLK